MEAEGGVLCPHDSGFFPSRQPHKREQDPNDYSDTETGGLDSYNADKRLFQGVWRRQTRLEELGLAEPLPVRTLLYFDHKWLFYC